MLNSSMVYSFLPVNGDDNPPVISNCPTDFTIFVATSNTLGTPTWTAPSASDETGQTQFTTNLSPLASLAVGTYPVTYTFEDPSSNEAFCNFEVTIAGKLNLYSAIRNFNSRFGQCLTSLS